MARHVISNKRISVTSVKDFRGVIVRQIQKYVEYGREEPFVAISETVLPCLQMI